MSIVFSNISKKSTIDNMNRTGLKEMSMFFYADYNTVDTNNILDIHIYLMKETWYKIMLFSDKGIEF